MNEGKERRDRRRKEGKERIGKEVENEEVGQRRKRGREGKLEK